MTANQVAYQQLLENKRHNLVDETVKTESNLIRRREADTNRIATIGGLVTSSLKTLIPTPILKGR